MKNSLLTTTLTLAFLVVVGATAQPTSEPPAQSGQGPSDSSGMQPMSPRMMDEDMMAMMMRCMKMMEGMMGTMDMDMDMDGAGMTKGQMNPQMQTGGSQR